MEVAMENSAPAIYNKLQPREISETDYDSEIADPFDEREIFGKRNFSISKLLSF